MSIKHLCRSRFFRKNQSYFKTSFESPSLMQHIDVKLDFVNKPIEFLITEIKLKFPIPIKKAENTAYIDIILACVLSSYRLYQSFGFFLFDFKFFKTKESFWVVLVASVQGRSCKQKFCQFFRISRNLMHYIKSISITNPILFSKQKIDFGTDLFMYFLIIVRIFLLNSFMTEVPII